MRALFATTVVGTVQKTMMLALLATSVVGTTIQADGFRYTLIKEQSECNSNDSTRRRTPPPRRRS